MCNLEAMTHGWMNFYLNSEIEIEFAAGMIASLSIIRLHRQLHFPYTILLALSFAIKAGWQRRCVDNDEMRQ